MAASCHCGKKVCDWHRPIRGPRVVVPVGPISKVLMRSPGGPPSRHQKSRHQRTETLHFPAVAKAVDRKTAPRARAAAFIVMHLLIPLCSSSVHASVCAPTPPRAPPRSVSGEEKRRSAHSHAGATRTRRGRAALCMCSAQLRCATRFGAARFCSSNLVIRGTSIATFVWEGS